MTLDLASIEAVALDMDGVLWRASQVMPGIPGFFDFLQRRAIPFAFATNNSTTRVAAYVERLRAIGIPARPEQVVTSAVATADYVSRRYPPSTPLYIIGDDGIRAALAERGFREDPPNAQVVVVGLDFAATFDKFKLATLRIRAGADFIGTNGDRTFPLPEGLVPGNGALLAFLETATDVVPVVIGKPERVMFDVTLSRLGTEPQRTLMVGDRIETDIVGAQRAGWQTALVLTGVTTAQQAAADGRAGAVFDTLQTLREVWEAASG
jgi:4-nitrophenyl phosphatase